MALLSDWTKRKRSQPDDLSGCDLLQTGMRARGNAWAREWNLGVNDGDMPHKIEAKEVAGMAKIGRPMGTKKYKPKAFREGCEAYFASISYAVPVTRPEVILNDDGFPALDDYGHPLYRYIPVITADGKEAWETKWTEPPSIQGLCLFLGIDASTFSRYMKGDPEDPEGMKLAEAARLAKARVETYLISRLEDKGAANGTKFNLQHNFGWMEKKEIELGAGAQKAVTAAGMTMEQKLALLTEIGAEVPE